MERKLEVGERVIYYTYGLFIDAEVITYKPFLKSYDLKNIKTDSSDEFLNDIVTVQEWDIYQKTIDGYADMVERAQNKRDYFEYKINIYKEEIKYLEKLEEQKLNKVEG